MVIAVPLFALIYVTKSLFVVLPRIRLYGRASAHGSVAAHHPTGQLAANELSGNRDLGAWRSTFHANYCAAKVCELFPFTTRFRCEIVGADRWPLPRTHRPPRPPG